MTGLKNQQRNRKNAPNMVKLTEQERLEIQSALDRDKLHKNKYDNLIKQCEQKGEPVPEPYKKKLSKYTESIQSYNELLKAGEYPDFSVGTEKKDWKENHMTANLQNKLDREFPHIKDLSGYDLADKADRALSDTIRFRKLEVKGGEFDNTSIMPEPLQNLLNGKYKNNPGILKLKEIGQAHIDEDQIVTNISILRQREKEKAVYESRGSFGKWWFRKSYTKMMKNCDDLYESMVSGGFARSKLDEIIKSPDEQLAGKVYNASQEYEKSYNDFVKLCTDCEKHFQNIDEEVEKQSTKLHELEHKLDLYNSEPKTRAALKVAYSQSTFYKENYSKKTPDEKRRGFEEWLSIKETEDTTLNNQKEKYLQILKMKNNPDFFKNLKAEAKNINDDIAKKQNRNPLDFKSNLEESKQLAQKLEQQISEENNIMNEKDLGDDFEEALNINAELGNQ